MTNTNRFERADWIRGSIFFTLAIALRVPFRSQFAYHWDSVQFALAVREYSVVLSQPHAPGYFLYVMLGRLVNLLVGDPHVSLVWLSVFFGAALTAVMYLLGARMFGRRAGFAAALFAMTSPLSWFYSCVALTYIVDSFLVCLLVLLCWRALRDGGRWIDVVLIGVAAAVVGGVRIQTLPALLPLLGYTFWKLDRRRVGKLVTVCIVAVTLSLAWAVPEIMLSGGLHLFGKAFSRYAPLNASITMAGGGWQALELNIFLMTQYWWEGMLLLAVVLAAGLFRRIYKMAPERKLHWDSTNRLALQTLALWIIPMMCYFAAVAFTRAPGHGLGYLPAWWLLAAVVIAELRKTAAFVAVTAIVCLVNGGVFWGGPLPGRGIFPGVRYCAREISDHDEQLRRTIATIRSQYDASQTSLWVRGHYLFGLRHFQVYLPEFECYQVPPFNPWQMAVDPLAILSDGKLVLRASHGQLEFVSRIDAATKPIVLLVVPPGLTMDIFDPYVDLSKAQPLQQLHGTLYEIPAEQTRL